MTDEHKEFQQRMAALLAVLPKEMTGFQIVDLCSCLICTFSDTKNVALLTAMAVAQSVTGQDFSSKKETMQ